MWRPLVLIAVAAMAAACGISHAGQSNSDPQSIDRRDDALEFAYALQILDHEGRTHTVHEDAQMRSGDRFALLVKNSAPMNIYVFNRGRGDNNYRRLFPTVGQTPHVNPSWEAPLRLPQNTEAWMRLDRKAGNENLLLIASKTPIDKFEDKSSIGRKEIDDVLAEIERNQRPREVHRWEEGNWTRLKTEARQPGLVLVCRIPLLHR